MARTFKEDAYAVKRNEILDATQRLVLTKGYERMSIQDILDELQISKGAFYHYFTSKQALLEALIERMLHEAEQIILPVVEDAQLPALEKFLRFFDTIARWKTARKTFFMALLRSWYSDDNVLVRQKVNAMGVKWYTPLLTTIIQQGVRENVLTTPYPDQVAEVVLALIVSLGDSIGGLFLPDELNEVTLQRIESTINVYTDALERVLGAPSHSIQLMDAETLKEWEVT